MRIAVASGKGGTGKTTVATSLVNVWPKKLVVVDMDVEEPNLHLFLNPLIYNRCLSKLKVPVVDKNKCNHCGLCSDFCQFSAITLAGNNVLTFPEMCHGCGGCILVCPEKAISTENRILGEIHKGRVRDNIFLMGKMRVGEAMSPPLMRHINDQIKSLDNKDIYDYIVDCPPGTSCPSINAVLDSDLILLVTEPTPFGLYDLKLAYKAFLHLRIPMAVIINRFGLGKDKITKFCKNNNISIVSRIPYDKKIAVCYSHGKPILETSDTVKQIFVNIHKEIQILLEK